MKRMVESVFIASLVAVVLSWWNKDTLADLDLSDGLQETPVQSIADRNTFSVSYGGANYEVEPQFRYEMSGLVVSTRHHDGDSMLHKYWNDHLNVADLCVLWGDNAYDLDLTEFSFRSGQFTCFVETQSNIAWRRFRLDQLANNHLLSESPAIRNRIGDVQIGDEIRVEGYLASYSNEQGFRRGTSTVRDDTGDGACETIYVTDFRVTQSMSNIWRMLFSLSGFGLLVSSVGWLFAVVRGSF